MLSKERDLPKEPITEAQTEQYSPEDFLEKLYANVFDWLIKDQKGKVVGEVGPQEIDSWDSHQADPGRITQLSIRLLRGVFIKTQKHDFALVLGRRRRSKYDHEETLGLQFGLQPSPGSKRFEELPLVDKLRFLTTSGGYGNGDFYQDSMIGRGIRTDSWADSSIFGGQEINRWKENKLLTDKGINASLEIVQRTTRNAFLR